MDKELELKLVKKYPKLFRDYGGDMKVTCMHWGCEFQDGWYNIFDNLCYGIQSFTDRTSYSSQLKSGELQRINCPQLIFDQAKEKFGTLTIYSHFEPYLDYENFKNQDEVGKIINRLENRVAGMINLAELLSKRICEKCGAENAMPSDTGWIKTLCNDCKEKRYELI